MACANLWNGEPIGRERFAVMKHTWLIYTSCGVTLEKEAKSLASALQKVPRELEVVAAAHADAVVKPSTSQPITVMIVGNRKAMPLPPEEYR